MTEKSAAYFEQRARVLKALAHPSRLHLIALLTGGERCVCELTPRVGADQSTVSKHLALLKSAGLVADRRQGAQVFYRLRRNVLRGAVATLESLAGGRAAAAAGEEDAGRAAALLAARLPAEESIA
jgi:ArsR family transcriptional regulator